MRSFRVRRLSRVVLYPAPYNQGVASGVRIFRGIARAIFSDFQGTRLKRIVFDAGESVNI
jgi:hypothetical protein